MANLDNVVDQMIHDHPLALVVEDLVDDDHVGVDQLLEVQLLAAEIGWGSNKVSVLELAF